MVFLFYTQWKIEKAQPDRFSFGLTFSVCLLSKTLGANENGFRFWRMQRKKSAFKASLLSMPRDRRHVKNGASPG